MVYFLEIMADMELHPFESEQAHPGMLAESADVDTLTRWSSIEPLIADRQFVLGLTAAAYEAGVYKIMRDLKRPAGTYDVPVGAAVGFDDQNVWQGFSQDRELDDDPGSHAELMAIRNLLASGNHLGGLTLAVTV